METKGQWEGWRGSADEMVTSWGREGGSEGVKEGGRYIEVDSDREVRWNNVDSCPSFCAAVTFQFSSRGEGKPRPEWDSVLTWIIWRSQGRITLSHYHGYSKRLIIARESVLSITIAWWDSSSLTRVRFDFHATVFSGKWIIPRIWSQAHISCVLISEDRIGLGRRKRPVYMYIDGHWMLNGNNQMWHSMWYVFRIG